MTIPSEVFTVIVALPSAMAVTAPLFTVATAVSLDVQVTLLSAALAGLTVAIRVGVLPTARLRPAVFRVTPVTAMMAGDVPVPVVLLPVEVDPVPLLPLLPVEDVPVPVLLIGTAPPPPPPPPPAGLSQPIQTRAAARTADTARSHPPLSFAFLFMVHSFFVSFNK
jgi:hypothetical protein